MKRSFIEDLNTPSFKQTTGGWQDKITSCGDTMYNEGCYITSAAMVFKGFGDSVDPGSMLEELRPADCLFNWSVAATKYNHTLTSTVSGSFDSLKAQMFDIIMNQKKAIIYCVSGSSTHAVVIKGFNGTLTVDPDTLQPWTTEITSAMFKVNDPGSSTNTTLAQVLAKYPTSVKYVLYSK